MTSKFPASLSLCLWCGWSWPVPSQVTSSSLAEKWKFHTCNSPWDSKSQLGSEVWVARQAWAPPVWCWITWTVVCIMWGKWEAIQAVRCNSHTWNCLWRCSWGCCLQELAALAERWARFCHGMGCRWGEQQHPRTSCSCLASSDVKQTNF